MTHEDREFEFVRKHLRVALPSLRDPELNVDLWPRMLRRLDEAPVTFGWFESMLVALVAITCVIFPELLMAVLYHL
jgi:hypothetical protein